jgi:hypothetical protein
MSDRTADDEPSRARSDIPSPYDALPTGEQDMDDYCWIHADGMKREAKHVIVVDGPNVFDADGQPFHREVGACDKHAAAVNQRNPNFEALKEDANPAKAQAVIQACKDDRIEVTVDRKTRTADLGRNSMGLRTPMDAPVPTKEARTITPPPPPTRPPGKGGRYD